MTPTKIGNVVNNVQWRRKGDATLSNFTKWLLELTTEQRDDYVKIYDQEFPDTTMVPLNSKLAIYYKKYIKGESFGSDGIYNPVMGNYDEQFTNFMMHYMLMTKAERESFKQLYALEFPQLAQPTTIHDRLLIEPVFDKHFYKAAMRTTL